MIDLKDDFYSTKSEREVKRQGIYFPRSISNTLNMVHDDHYHVVFKMTDKAYRFGDSIVNSGQNLITTNKIRTDSSQYFVPFLSWIL